MCLIVLRKYDTYASSFFYLFENIAFEHLSEQLLSRSGSKLAKGHPFPNRRTARIRAQQIKQFFENRGICYPFIIRSIKVPSYQIVKLDSI